MNNKETNMEDLKSYASNRVSCNKHQIFNVQELFNRYLSQIEENITKIKEKKEKKEYRFERCKDIYELASRLRILCELDLQYATELGAAEHILRDLEALKNDTE